MEEQNEDQVRNSVARANAGERLEKNGVVARAHRKMGAAVPIGSMFAPNGSDSAPRKRSVSSVDAGIDLGGLLCRQASPIKDCLPLCWEQDTAKYDLGPGRVEWRWIALTGGPAQ